MAAASANKQRTVVLVANSDWYLWNFRRSLALALRDEGYRVLLLSPPGEYVENLRSLGLTWHPLEIDRGGVNPLSEIRLVVDLVGYFVRERPVVVHGFAVKCAVYCLLAARIARVPARIAAVAGMGYVFVNGSLKARLLRPVVLALFKLAFMGRRTRVILQNPDDIALFERAGLVAPARVRLIPGSGVDCRRFSPRPELRFPEPAKVLLPARLLRDKGVMEYVEAIRILRGRNVAGEFLLAGAPDPGNPASVSEAIVREWAMDGLLAWLGQVDEMASLLRRVDIVVLPSYREGLPKGLIEAAACGCALVTTDAPGCREVVAHEVHGLLVPVRDSVALADAIQRLIEDAPLRRRLGSAARDRAVAEFEESIIVDMTLDVYRELSAPSGRLGVSRSTIGGRGVRNAGSED